MFATQFEPPFEDEFVQTGIARFTFRHFPHLGPASEAAALAAECAADQDAFFPYHDALFERQAQGLSSAELDGAARAAGLDLDRFSDCLDSRTHQDALMAGAEEARRLGIASTPFVLVNGVRVPLSTAGEFLALLRALAAQAGN